MFKSILSWAALAIVPCHAALSNTLAERNDLLLSQLQSEHHLSDAQMVTIKAIFGRSKIIGQGNPAVTEHPETEAQCHAKLSVQQVNYANAKFEQICGAKFMAPLYNAKTASADQARACIDQFEFPNIPCAYPVVWVKVREAAEICEAEGERLCDAHEWEGACAGSLEEPDYDFQMAKAVPPGVAISRLRVLHNAAHQKDKSWSYGPEYRTDMCATGGSKTPGCPGGNWQLCGSNTYPTGDFPACHSSLAVYDLNGNAAEQMNMPLSREQMSSAGSKELGYTEMKGSWFVFNQFHAHEDWCRWRAPFWHGTRVMDEHSHANYHLGFRCCKTLSGTK